MFKLLFTILHELESRNLPNLKEKAGSDRKDYREFLSFIDNLKKFAFYDDLKTELVKRRLDIERLLAQERYREILIYLLYPEGLNYADLPKGLIKFHQYPDGTSCTPFEEHLVEAAAYTRDRKGNARIHFTIPDSNASEHEVIGYINTVKHHYEQAHAVQFDISFSYQSPATDTIAVDLNNRPFRDQEGILYFRPGGHGALLDNLSRLEGDIVFLKNIGNFLFSRLNRPLRVCGMVKNQGEPGGGPFWVKQEDRSLTLQIVETSQIDRNDPGQQRILQSATHFNPVDIVCGLRDFRGQVFHLPAFSVSTRMIALHGSGPG